jgi:hypothetical protein
LEAVVSLNRILTSKRALNRLDVLARLDSGKLTIADTASV